MTAIAVGQFAPGSDKAANLDTIRRLAGSARDHGAALLALPEYSSFMAPALDGRIVESAEPVDGRFTDAVGRLAREHELAVVLGINELVPGEPRVHSTLVFVDADGNIAGRYRKLHLYDAFGARESDWILPGAPEDEIVTVTLDGLVCAAQTCYDLRFPEVTRTLVDAGSDLVVVPAQWVPGPLKEEHWTTLLRARAIENTVYVAGADQRAPYGSGRSLVVDPLGLVLADLGERDGVACVEVERARIDEVRATNPSLAARRFAVVPRPAGSTVDPVPPRG